MVVDTDKNKRRAGQISRRSALGTLLAGGAASCTSTPDLTAFKAVRASTASVFTSGVASGDPTQSGFIIWSRIGDAQTGLALDGEQPVDWQVANDAGFSTIVQSGQLSARASSDGTLKVDVGGLQPGTSYFYRFTLGDTSSPTGHARTLPSGSVDSARFAVISCSNFPFGYFNVYDQISRRDDLDAVIHLGDYLYEYGTGGYGGEVGKQLGRNHAPTTEIITLADYRERHRQYKSDPATQSMHAAHAFIAIWDDHETANNSWKEGAQNHQPETEGEWADRRAAALRAYYEWMPVREPSADRPREAFFRKFSYGDLLTLGAIETRLMARSEELSYNDLVASVKSPEDIDRFRREVLNDPSRQMLGKTQEAWLSDILQESKQAGQPWRIIANQIIMARVTAPDLTPHVTEEELAELQAQWDQARAFVQASTLGLPTNFDAWDGYPAARQRFYDLAEDASKNDGLIVLTGDTHTWWANDLISDDGDNIGVELGVGSVTSPSPYRKEFLGGKGAEYALLTNQKNKDVRYINGEDHGYIDLHVTPSKVDARFMAVDTVLSPEYNAFQKAKFTIGKRKSIAQFKGISGVGLKERFLF